MTGKTYFSRDGCFYPKVPEDGLIRTAPFLHASEEVLDLFDRFGTVYSMAKSDVGGNVKVGHSSGYLSFFASSFSSLHSVVKKDINGNIQKLKTKQALNPELYVTIDAMFEDEQTKKDTNVAQESALWLKRGLDFLCTTFENFLEIKEEDTNYFSPCVTSAYEKVLKPFHGYATQKIFSVLSKLLPYKSQLIQKLKQDETVEDELVWSEMKVYVALMRENLEALNVTLKKYNIDSSEKY